MARSYDAIVIGAGVMGASTAMQLACAGVRRLLLVEKGPGPGFGSTGRSSACIRQTYSNPEVVLMAYESLQFFRNWREFTGLAAPRADFHRTGVVFLMPADDPALPTIEANHRRAGVAYELLDAPEQRRRFPDLDFCSAPLDLAGDEHECSYRTAAVHELDGGFADPVGTTQDLLEVAQAHGLEVRYNTRVTGVLTGGGRVRGIETATAGGGETFSAPAVINCAGPWAPALNALAGAPLRERLVATRNQIVCKRFPEQLRGPIPMVADMVTGIYFRNDPTGTQLVIGSAREEDEREAVADPDRFNEGTDAAFREEKLLLTHHRVPTFRARGQITSYSGLYTVNREDYHPIIDETELAGFYAVCGFSGHGFKLSPVVGMLVAQKVLGQWGRGRTGVPPGFFNRNRAPLRTNWGGVMA